MQGSNLYSFFKSLTTLFKSKKKVDYTHWDIHALARVLDPSAWSAFDALPEIDSATGEKKYYGSFQPVSQSFKMAINALKSGIMATKEHLWSDEELKTHIKKGY